MAYWTVGAATGAAASVAGALTVSTADVAVSVVADVDGCTVSAVSESFGVLAAEVVSDAALGGLSSTGMESGVVGICRAVAVVAGACAASVTVVGSAAAWLELSDDGEVDGEVDDGVDEVDDVDEVDGVDVFVCAERVELGLFGPVPEVVVVVTLRSGSSDPPLVDCVVSAPAAV